VLKPETQSLWDEIRDQPALHGFVLIGGTALAMHIQHRVSEDLDIAWPGHKLPRQRIAALRKILQLNGHVVAEADPIEAIEEFEDSGLDLHDFNQNFIVDQAVKLTFMAPEEEVLTQLNAGNPGALRIASKEEIFRLKCIACANRSKTRDWFDMYTLFERGDFQPTDMIHPFENAGLMQKLDIALTRMCGAKPELGDEGYVQLLDNPPTLEKMRQRFMQARDEIEIELAARRAKASGPKQKL